MAGRTPSEAVNNFLEPLQQARSCVTDVVINIAGGYHPSATPHVLLIGAGDTVPVRSVSRALSIKVSQHYRVVEAESQLGPWKVQTAAYNYMLLDGAQEVFAYHWHPSGEPSWPHLHVYASDFARAHFPTGRIAIEEFLRLLIVEFDVTPLKADWQEVLLRTQAAHEMWRTWS